MPVSRTPAAVATKEQPKETAVTEYVPFAAQDPIKLSVQIVQNLIAVPTRSGLNCSPKDAIRFIAMCKSRGLNPFEGDAFLIGFDSSDGSGPKFNLITAHQAFLKRAELHKEYDGMTSGVIVFPGYTCGACEGKRIVFPPNAAPLKCPICDGAGLIDEIEGDIVPEEQRLAGGWSRVFFKNRKVAMHKRIPLEPFKKPFGVWKDNPSGMIVKCAEADGLRSAFPTMLGGLYLREEIDLFPSAPPASSAPPPSFLTPIGGEEAAQPTKPTETPPQGAPANEQKPAQEPSKAESASQSTPEPETQPAGEPAQPSGPSFVSLDQATADSLEGEKLVFTVAAVLKQFGCTEEQLTKWAQVSMQAKANQTWRDMSQGKIRNILTKWAGIGPVVKETKV